MRAPEELVTLAADHSGMRVDYSGLLKQSRAALRESPWLAEMLRQLGEHLAELGARYYAGDVSAVDEFLQLYCVNREGRVKVRNLQQRFAPADLVNAHGGAAP